MFSKHREQDWILETRELAHMNSAKQKRTEEAVEVHRETQGDWDRGSYFIWAPEESRRRTEELEPWGTEWKLELDVQGGRMLDGTCGKTTQRKNK